MEVNTFLIWFKQNWVVILIILLIFVLLVQIVDW